MRTAGIVHMLTIVQACSAVLSVPECPLYKGKLDAVSLIQSGPLVSGLFMSMLQSMLVPQNPRKMPKFRCAHLFESWGLNL